MTRSDLILGIRILPDQLLCAGGFHMVVETIEREPPVFSQDYIMERSVTHCLSCGRLFDFEHRPVSLEEIVESAPVGIRFCNTLAMGKNLKPRRRAYGSTH